MASFALVSKYGIPPLDWQKAIARFDGICYLSLDSMLQARKTWKIYHTLALFHIDLVTNNNLQHR
jgi:hypothetical protein